jgi:hypothetical protein
MATAFKTNPISLEDLLKDCRSGKLQLPDFQRSWVWDEDRIKSLIASISRAFPIGALMTLETGDVSLFQPRPIEGAPDAARNVKPSSLLLDGQQRMTSLYHVALRGEVVRTITLKKKHVNRWFYVDIVRALDPSVEREEAILSIPENKIVAADFNRTVVLDVSTQEQEFRQLMFPLFSVFDWDNWQLSFFSYWSEKGDLSEKLRIIKAFKDQVLDNFTKDSRNDKRIGVVGVMRLIDSGVGDSVGRPGCLPETA